MSGALLVAGLSTAVVAVFRSAALLHARWAIPHEHSRKLVHLGVGLVAGLLPLYVTRWTLVLSACSLFILLPLGDRRGWFAGVVRPGRSLAGPLWFLAGYLALLLVVQDAFVICQASVVFAVADSSAAVVGQRWGRRRMANSRTWAGSATFFGTTTVIVASSEMLRGQPTAFALTVAVGAAIALASVEAVAPSALDNLLIPVVGACYLSLSRRWDSTDVVTQSCAFGFTLLVATVANRRRWLTADGALAVVAIGCVMFAAEQLSLIAVMLLFFVSSSVLTRLGTKRLVQDDAVRGRTARQAVALGGLPAFAAVAHSLGGPEALLGAATAAVAAASADTLATEVGRHSAKEPRLITTLRRCPRGASGGVTGLGLAGGLAGAAMIATAAGLTGLVDAKQASLVAAIGFGACLLDSLLGATVQAGFQCVGCGAVSETADLCHGERMRQVHGWSMLSNEGVNFVMSSVAAGAFIGATYS